MVEPAARTSSRPSPSKLPVLSDRLTPCNNACPAGENIQGWLFQVEAGAFEAAWRLLTADNPLPATMGRICYHPCESCCNRGELDSPVAINAVERFLGDEAIRRGWTFAKPAQESGKRVLVVGAGPSGLSAAYHLRRHGHTVQITDASPAAGGMMRYGIPKYRLPRDVLDAEIKRIADMGISLMFDSKITNLREAMTGFDAAFLAIGAHIGKRTDIPAGTASRVLDAATVLRSMEQEEKPQLGRRVVIYGGGNTALDMARTARRLGAEESVIVYRRTRGKMPAHHFEVDEAVEEGVKMRWLSTIKSMEGGRLTIEKMELDANGFPQPTGTFETLDADTVVLALGQECDLGLVEGIPEIVVKNGVVKVGRDMMTGMPGIFAGGDMVPADRTATVAIGHGCKAARHIDAWLRGADCQPEPKRKPATFDRLNTWYYDNAWHTRRPKLDGASRQSSFAEITGGLDDATAAYEARRCLSCGNCFECDNCYGMCPDNAVVKLGTGKRYAFRYEDCSGCGICAKECPCGAIDMIDVHE